MKTLTIAGQQLHRQLSAFGAAALLLTAANVAAQNYDPQREAGIDYPRQQRPGNDQQGSDSPGDEAATTQVQTGRDSRYTPDQIDTNEGAGDSRQLRGERARNDDEAGDRQEARRPPRSVPALAQPGEFEAYVSQIADKTLRRFGANLLVPEARDFTASPTTSVPPDYRINPGDELVLGITGSVNAENLRLRVDPDGRIFIPRVGALRVAGVRYGDLQSVISARVARQYRNFNVAVTIGELHGLTVYVTGFAKTPGSYTVTSLSTLVNAVLAAGGPSAGGSFRSIQLRRGGKLISDFDLYDFLLKGDKTADAVLQNGDVIYIAPVGAQVAVIGSVNNEAIFEARPGDKLTDVLIYAGGVNTVADDTRLLVLDPMSTTSGWEQLTPKEAANRVARRAEILRVLSGVGLTRPVALQPVLVTVNGEVQRPGRYYVPAGTPIEAAIAQAGGLTNEAFPFGTVFTRDALRQQQRQAYDRALRDAQYMLTTTPLTSALQSDQNQVARLEVLRSTIAQLEQRRPDGRLVLEMAPDALTVPGDLILENNDTIYVPPKPVAVGVFGSVRSPASFRFDHARTIGDYVRLAGGVQKVGDMGGIFVVRANGTLLARGRGAFSGSVLKQRALPGDLVYVPINASRNEFWAKLRDLTQVMFSGALTAATIAAIN